MLSETSILIIGLCSLAGTVLTLRAWMAKEQLKAQTELAKAQRYQRMQAKAAASRKAKNQGPPEWLADVLDRFGIDEDVLESDEMPEELQRALPMLEGFLQSGAGQAVLSRISGQRPLSEDEVAREGNYA
jgi:hypothetical protein